MIRLHGHPVSNYYNKVKLALLEKGLPFEEVPVDLKALAPEVRDASPLGKIPFLSTADGRSLCESQVILEYLEQVHPQPALLPADPYAAAKVRELATFIDWHLEMTARQLYATAFFGAAPLSESNAARIRRELERQAAGLRRLVRFSPYVVGDQFTLADCCAYASLPVVAMATQRVYGEDLLAAAGIDHAGYVRFIAERPSAQRVTADRKAATRR